MSTNYELKEDKVLTERRPYKNRVRSEVNKNRKYIKILNQSANLIDAQIEEYPLATDEQEGTAITAEVLQEFHDVIEQSDYNAKSAFHKSNNAEETADRAETNSETAIATANTAEGNSVYAKNLSEQTHDELVALQQQVVGQQGTKVTENGGFVPVFDADKKLNKLTNQVNKEVTLTANGVVHVGQFEVGNSNITIDISTTTSIAGNARLIIAAQNNIITEMSVFNDEKNVITPQLYIKPSSVADSKLDVYFISAINAKSIFEIKAVDAEIVKACEIISVVPVEASARPINIINDKILQLNTQISTLQTQHATDMSAIQAQHATDISSLNDQIGSLQTQITTLQTDIANMKSGNAVFTLLKANSIDLV